MPTYEYECSECGHTFEAFHAMSAEPLVECPECGQPKLKKLIGMGAAAIVRGTKTPCTGRRGNSPKKQKMSPKGKDKLGEGKNKSPRPWWRDGPINPKILDKPDKYIAEGEV